ncbi:MAG: hypothetical protein ACUZ77_04305 [Candidatus Brocadiales bacterium]
MSPISKNFVRASLIYFCIGVILGVSMFFHGSLRGGTLPYIHGHIMLLGWLSMMIYGVGYHILPRFSGNPVAYPTLSVVHFYWANSSFVAFMLSYTFFLKGASVFPTNIFAALHAISIFMFAFNIWCSIVKPKED